MISSVGIGGKMLWKFMTLHRLSKLKQYDRSIANLGKGTGFAAAADLAGQAIIGKCGILLRLGTAIGMVCTSVILSFFRIRKQDFLDLEVVRG